jgi:hypothetical protein
MAPLDVAKELAEILTSAFGKGWGWAAFFFLRRALKKTHFELVRFCTNYYGRVYLRSPCCPATVT